MRAGEDTACSLENETLGFALLVPDRDGQVAPELQTRHLRWSPFLHATLLSLSLWREHLQALSPAQLHSSPCG